MPNLFTVHSRVQGHGFVLLLSHFCPPQARSMYWAADYMWIGPLSQTAFMQGHLQHPPHTLNSSHWSTVLWRPSFFLCCLADFSCLLVSSVKRRLKKGKWVCVRTSATSLSLSDRCGKRKTLAVGFITAFHINILLKATKSVCFILFFLCRVCSLIEQSLAWYLQWLLCSCQMHKLFHSQIYQFVFLWTYSYSNKY